jgi:hypothetical protein
MAPESGAIFLCFGQGDREYPDFCGFTIDRATAMDEPNRAAFNAAVAFTLK